MCGHPAPGIRHLGKVMLPLAKVKLPPSQSTGQYQQGRQWERRQPWPAQGGCMLSSLHRGPPIAGNQVLTEYLWDWHLGVVPLGSSRPLGDQRGNEGFLNPSPCPSRRRSWGLLTPHCSLQRSWYFPTGCPGAPPGSRHKHPWQRRMLPAYLRGPCLEQPSCPQDWMGWSQKWEMAAGQMGVPCEQELRNSEG